MGICGSKNEASMIKINNEIDRGIRDDKLKQSSEVKMLLLGAGDSGKSTILKQMRLIHGDKGFSQDELHSYRDLIFDNIIQNMKEIIEAMKQLQISFADRSKSEPLMLIVLEQRLPYDATNFNQELCNAIKTLWKDNGVLDCYDKRAEFQLADSAKYFFDSIDRISAPNYSPSTEDILRARYRTTGIVETTFVIGHLTYRMFDVGGQRSERKKWIHCFENVTAIVFLAAISEYDQSLVEDKGVNRIREALSLFDNITNSRWFEKTSIILFLNKIDLLKEKLPKSPIKNHFPQYKGVNSYESACEFFKDMFHSMNHSESKQIYTHFTCATDTNQIKFVMSAVNDIIVQSNLKRAGLMAE